MAAKDKGIQHDLEEQDASLSGQRGARLMLVNVDTGAKVGSADLPSPPVFDGMVVARGKIYIATAEGHVICIGNEVHLQHSPRWRSLGMACLAVVFACNGGPVRGCTIPVFRFALDRWESDAFRLEVPAATAKQAETAKLLVPLRGNGSANLKVKDAGASPDVRLLDSRDGKEPIWSGALNSGNLNTILESPARQELLKRILDGESVIWVVVDDGKPESKAAADRVEKRPRHFEQAHRPARLKIRRSRCRVGTGPVPAQAHPDACLHEGGVGKAFLRDAGGPEMRRDAGAWRALCRTGVWPWPGAWLVAAEGAG